MENVIIECSCGHEYPARVSRTHIEELDAGLTLREEADQSCPECDHTYEHEEPVTGGLRRVKIPKGNAQG